MTQAGLNSPVEDDGAACDLTFINLTGRNDGTIEGGGGAQAEFRLSRRLPSGTRIEYPSSTVAVGARSFGRRLQLMLSQSRATTPLIRKVYGICQRC